jgi:hypothetical protein
MNLRRCPSCRTFCEVERDALCPFCGAQLPDAAGTPRAAPPILREASRDFGTSRIVFAVIGLLALVSFDLSLQGFRARLAFLAAAVLAVLVRVLARRTMGLGSDSAGRDILNALAAFGVQAAVLVCIGVGLLILLFIVCAAGGLNFG